MLAACQAIESNFGRVRDDSEVRWGPRTLDVDVLLCGARGEQVVSLPDLEVPHPRMHERAFALAPLVDLDATLVHPTEGRPLRGLFVAAQHQGQAVAPTGDVL